MLRPFIRLTPAHIKSEEKVSAYPLSNSHNLSCVVVQQSQSIWISSAGAKKQTISRLFRDSGLRVDPGLLTTIPSLKQPRPRIRRRHIVPFRNSAEEPCKLHYDCDMLPCLMRRTDRSQCSSDSKYTHRLRRNKDLQSSRQPGRCPYLSVPAFQDLWRRREEAKRTIWPSSPL